MGYSDQQIEEALGELGRISLDDDSLEAVMGKSGSVSNFNRTEAIFNRTEANANYDDSDNNGKSYFNISIR